MAQSLANVLALLRKMFARERLPEPPAEAPPRRPGPGTLRFVLGREQLSEEPVRPPPSRPAGPVAALFGPERLPEDPASPGARDRGIVSLVLGRESLPEDPPGPPRHRGRWAAWLFAPEPIDAGPDGAGPADPS